MPQVQSYLPGEFSWCEAATTDQTAAKEFYSKVFGWTCTDSEMGPSQYYTMFYKDSLPVAGMMTIDEELKAMGVPPHWNTYINVASVDESTDKAAALGATILAPAFDVMDVGRMSVIQDPGGAVFYLWQKAKHFGAAVHSEPGSFCWYELAVKDTETAKKFYTELFDWGTAGTLEYTEWTMNGTSIGGMMSLPDVPPNWLPYIMVSDCDASAALAQQNGATILMGPGNAGEHGRFCVLLDPQGAAFAIYQRM